MEIKFQRTMIDGVESVKLPPFTLYRVGDRIFTTNNEAILFLRLKTEEL